MLLDFLGRQKLLLAAGLERLLDSVVDAEGFVLLVTVGLALAGPVDVVRRSLARKGLLGRNVGS